MNQVENPSLRPSAKNPWVVLFAVSLAQLTSVMGVTFLFTALPQIAIDLNTNLGGAQWIVIAYTLAMAATVPLWGRLSDLRERKDLFLLGVLLYAGGGILGSFAQTTEMLIFARAIQGLGGASTMANSLAIVTDVFPAKDRGLAFGVLGVMASGGGALGLVVGGVVISHVGWEATFQLIAGLGAFVFAIAAWGLPRGNVRKRNEPVDWLGAVLLAAALGSALLAITRGQQWGWESGRVLSLFASGLTLGLLFLVVEQRSRFPLVNLSLFKSRAFTLGQLAGLFSLGAISTSDFLMPFFWQAARGFSAQEAGLLMVPFSAGIFMSAPLAGRLMKNFAPRTLSLVGLLIVIAGAFAIAQVRLDMSLANILWRPWLAGAGFGMFFAPNNAVVMSSASSWARGSASGVLGMFRMVGVATGIAVSGVVLGTVVADKYEGLQSSLVTRQDFARAANDPQALTQLNAAFEDGFQMAFYVSIVFVLVGLFFTLLSPSQIEEAPEAVEEEERLPAAAGSVRQA